MWLQQSGKVSWKREWTRASVGSLVLKQVEASLHPYLSINSLNKHYSFLCASDRPDIVGRFNAT